MCSRLLKLGVLVGIGVLGGCGAGETIKLGEGRAAVVSGELDTAYPEAGVIVTFSSETPSLETVVGFCSGVLIRPRVFLTAAHCKGVAGEPGFYTFVAFGENLFETLAQGALIPIGVGDVIAHPSFTDGYTTSEDVIDLAVVRLPAPPPNIRPAALPEPGQLSRLAERGETAGPMFTLVGYGFHDDDSEMIDGLRRSAPEGFLALENAGWLKTDTNPLLGYGGGCGLDSGAPLFLRSLAPDGRHVVTGILSFLEGEQTGPALCAGEPNYHVRLDRVAALTFVATAARVLVGE